MIKIATNSRAFAGFASLNVFVLMLLSTGGGGQVEAKSIGNSNTLEQSSLSLSSLLMAQQARNNMIRTRLEARIISNIFSRDFIDSITMNDTTSSAEGLSNNSSCSSFEFRCNRTSDNQCILKSWVCDGQNDCRDGSDEADCGGDKCKTHMGRFRCANDRCIRSLFVCDGDNDCLDGSDEVNCSSRNRTTPLMSLLVDQIMRGLDRRTDGLDSSCGILNSHQCANGRCIPTSFVCDGDNDCLDGSDESSCEENYCETKFGKFQCANKQKCIQKRYLCDGDNDCTDGSDELITVCSAADRRVRLLSSNATDASLLNVTPPSPSSPTTAIRLLPFRRFYRSCSVVPDNNEFRCNSSLCIPKRFVCDGDNDCRDGSDESNCEENYCESKFEKFQCANKHRCLRKTWVCNGNDDCGDGSDEANCYSNNSTCRIFEFECANKQRCIPKRYMCDGDNDCRDGSDESNCEENYCESKFGKFQCANKHRCLRKTWVCDGTDDCGDGSDEVNCTNRNTATTTSLFDRIGLIHRPTLSPHIQNLLFSIGGSSAESTIKTTALPIVNQPTTQQPIDTYNDDNNSLLSAGSIITH